MRQPRVTVTGDTNLLVLSRMLDENGLYLVQVHARRITKMTKVPRIQSVQDLLDEPQRSQRPEGGADRGDSRLPSQDGDVTMECS